MKVNNKNNYKKQRKNRKIDIQIFKLRSVLEDEVKQYLL